jgi:hypothetical protein
MIFLKKESWNIRKEEVADGVTQEVEHLPRKREPPEFKPQYCQKKERKKE